MGRQIIFVGGKRFTIITDESEAYMERIVDRVETKLRSVGTANPKLDKDAVAILASLDYCDEENKLRTRLEEIKEQIKDYVEEITTLNEEVSSLKEENKTLKNKINEMLNVSGEKADGSKKEKKIIATGKIENSVPKIMDGAIQQSLFNNEKN